MNATNAPANRNADMRWLRWGLSAIAFLLALIVLELSVFVGPLQPRAQAQLPDSGAQLNVLIDGQKQINQTLQQILDQLRAGEIKVALSGADKVTRGSLAPAAPAGRPSPRPPQAAARAR
jgi:hypothetical protein